MSASQRLYRAITEDQLTLPADRELAAHASAAIARRSRRGGRLDKAERAGNIDAMVALAMAVEGAEARPAPLRVVGWV